MDLSNVHEYSRRLVGNWGRVYSAKVTVSLDLSIYFSFLLEIAQINKLWFNIIFAKCRSCFKHCRHKINKSSGWSANAVLFASSDKDAWLWSSTQLGFFWRWMRWRTIVHFTFYIHIFVIGLLTVGRRQNNRVPILPEIWTISREAKVQKHTDTLRARTRWWNINNAKLVFLSWSPHI